MLCIVCKDFSWYYITFRSNFCHLLLCTLTNFYLVGAGGTWVSHLFLSCTRHDSVWLSANSWSACKTSKLGKPERILRTLWGTSCNPWVSLSLTHKGEQTSSSTGSGSHQHWHLVMVTYVDLWIYMFKNQSHFYFLTGSDYCRFYDDVGL